MSIYDCESRDDTPHLNSLNSTSPEEADPYRETEDLTCFVCDSTSGESYNNLASCKTHKSKQSFVEKLGQLIGEKFVIVVSEDDVICSSCTATMNNLDCLERDLSSKRSVILKFLEDKYGLEGGELAGNKIILPLLPDLPIPISDVKNLDMSNLAMNNMSAGVANLNDELTTCFVCDDAIVGMYFTIGVCKTLCTKQSFVEKLGQLIGEKYEIVISEDDIMCCNCTNLVNDLDKIELKLSSERTVIFQALEKKYCLEEGELANNEVVPILPDSVHDMNLEPETDDGIHDYTRVRVKEEQDEMQDNLKITEQCSNKILQKNRLVSKAKHKNNISPENNIKCEYCPYKTRIRNYLLRHIKKHKEEKTLSCDQCSYRCKPGSLRMEKHMETHKKPFKCEFCSYRCKRARDMVLHNRTHTGERPYSCSLCPYKANRPSGLLVHMRTHSTEKLFRCEQCPYTANQRSHLVIHERTHTGEKPFSCDQCSYRSKRQGDLVIHMKNHIDDKPFQCSRCPFKSKRNGDLLAHTRIHTGEKQFVCDKCPFSCYQKSNLSIHLRTHSGEKPFECSECSFRTSVKGRLTTHMMTHTGEKPFACDRCPFRCNQKSNLTLHLTTHTGDKPFVCPHYVRKNKCTYKSNKKNQLLVHIMKIHS